MSSEIRSGTTAVTALLGERPDLTSPVRAFDSHAALLGGVFRCDTTHTQDRRADSTTHIDPMKIVILRPTNMNEATVRVEIPWPNTNYRHGAD